MNGENYPPPGGDEHSEEPDDPSLPSRTGSESRGYVPPSQRPWIHPSELSFGTQALSGGRSHGRPAIVLGVAAVAVLVAGVAVFSVRTQPSTTTSSVAVSAAQDLNTAPPALQSSARSLVSLTFQQGGTTEQTDGVVIDSQDVVTTASLPLHNIVDVTTSNGQRLSATVLKSDAASDLTLLHLKSSVPGFVSDTSSVKAGTLKVVSMSTASQGSSVKWAEASTVKSNQTMSRAELPLCVVIASSTLPPEAGNLLVSAQGSVVGIAAPDLGPNVYLPVSFVTSVGQHLASSTTTNHGYLQIDGADAATYGAKVTGVVAGGPAVGMLQIGDIITHLNAQPIASMAELIDGLYALSPGSTVNLTVLRNSAPRVVSITLASTP